MQIVKNNKNALSFKVNQDIYSLEVLHKCFYWYTDKFIVDIDVVSDKYLITFELKKGQEYQSISDELINKIKNDLIDFNLREIVYEETKTIREIINRKAFAN